MAAAPGEEAASSGGGRAEAEALAKRVLELQAAHEAELEGLRQRNQCLQAQVAKLTERNNQLEREATVREGALPASANILGCSGESIFLEEKGQFIKFVTAVANNGKESPEYKQLYQFLLKCFTDADNNFDGRVGYLEFETLIDAAAFLPRRFGYAPSTPELYATDFDRVKQRLALFNSLKPKKAKAVNKQSGTYDYISFHTWLHYAIEHIKEKAVLVKDVNPQSALESSKDDFQEFVLAACQSRRSQEYKELYHYVLKCFVDADTDMDGLIDIHSFSALIDIAAQAPRRFGFAPSVDETYESEEQKLSARAEIFRTLDKDGTGYIGFDSWLEYIYNHICEKAATLGSLGAVPAIEAAGQARSAPQCPWRV